MVAKSKEEKSHKKGKAQKAEKAHKRRSYKRELEKVTKENQELKEQLLRIAAEFDNYRKRSERDIRNVVENANAELVAKLLPVIDDLDRSVAANTEKSDNKSLLDGIKLLHKSFLKILYDQGLRAMECEGEIFDPEKHDALLQMKVDGKDPDMVIEEHLKGYKFKDRVIRHAKVIVSK